MFLMFVSVRSAATRPGAQGGTGATGGLTLLFASYERGDFGVHFECLGSHAGHSIYVEYLESSDIRT